MPLNRHSFSWRPMASALGLALVLAGCPMHTSQAPPGSPAPTASQQSAPEGRHLDPQQAERLKAVMTPLLQKMNHPIPLDQVRIGLMDEFCAHRGVSLWFGRNEENGLRCPYHGWKYDTNGQCVEVPSEPVESGFCKKIKLKSYPLVKRGPVLWTYMGEPEKQPPLPQWEFATVPAEQTFISKRLQESNWLQAMR